MAKLSPVFNDAQFINGVPANGAKVFTYAAGSSTKLATYTDEAGVVAQANPIILNSRGEPDSPIWLTEGQEYKFVFTASTDSDPPTSPIRTIDNISGVGDNSVSLDQWVDSGVTPTYVSATQFTLPGDQTSNFQVNRRIKATVTAGTVYGYITASAFAALTTVTVSLDSGNLDSGLSAVQLGLLTPDNTSAPILKDNNFMVSGSADKTKRLRFEVDGFTTATTRVITFSNKDYTPADLIEIPKVQEFRLTLTTGLPVTVSDVTGASTIYCTPYNGNRIALYDGTNWNVRTTAEFSLALSGLNVGRPYDVFCYDNAGTPTLEFTSWTNDTTRATALAYQDGVLVKSGTVTRRYLGTFYTTAATTTEDSAVKRFLWNYYHRVVRYMERYESTATWTYTTDTYRQANAATANQLDYVCGVAEDGVEAIVQSNATNTSPAVNIFTAVGVDSTSATSGLAPRTEIINNGAIYCVQAAYMGIPGVGRHFLVWLERSEATGTTTWTGTNSPLKSGIIGKVMA